MFTNILNRIDFFRKVLINSIFIIVLLLIFLGLLIAPFLSSSIDKKSSILVLDISSQASGNNTFFNFDNGLTTFQIVNVIESAKEDKEIEIILIDSSMMSLSATDALEIGQALENFKATGKKVVSYGDFFFQHQYLLASFANEILINPFGLVYIEGYKDFRLYFKNALEKYKIDVSTYVAGEYKSASEIFTNDSMTESTKIESRRFLGSLWNNWVEIVSSNREDFLKISIQKYIDDIGNLVSSAKNGSELAVTLGLADKVLNRIELEEYLLNLSNGKRKYYLNFLDYFEKISLPQSSNKLAIINAEGEIVDGDFDENNLSNGHFARLISKVKNGDFAGLLIRLNTPGGSGFASESIRQEILELKETGLPIIISMADIAASGGYWISADANEIWASPFSLTGSIGVWTAVPNFEESLNEVGINYDGISTTSFNPSLIKKPDANSNLLLQNLVDSAYQDFLDLVSKGRALDRTYTDSISQGKVWDADNAKEIGLIDQIGSQRNALDRLAELANINDYSIEIIESEKNYFDQIEKYFSGIFFNYANFFNAEKFGYTMKNILTKQKPFPFQLNLLCLECIKGL